jgi:hypothetical protein
MWKDTFTSKLLVDKEDSSLHPSLLFFNLPILISKMKHRQSWINGDPDTMILIKTPTEQVVLTALHEGTEITSFQSNESISLHIIEGKLKFHTRYESVNLDKGQLLTLRQNIKYSLTTKEETLLLLKIT